MKLNLVTGKTGQPHISSSDIGAFNAGVVGIDKYVLRVGSMFDARIVNSSIIIEDGEALLNGRHIRLEETASIDIPQGVNGEYYIVIRYINNIEEGIESAELTITNQTEYFNKSILDGDDIVDMHLYTVLVINGTTNINGDARKTPTHNYKSILYPNVQYLSYHNSLSSRIYVVNGIAFVELYLICNDVLPREDDLILGTLHSPIIPDKNHSFIVEIYYESSNSLFGIKTACIGTDGYIRLRNSMGSTIGGHQYIKISTMYPVV